MGQCPFATWVELSGSSGKYLSGPFKIVHHTTEGSTAKGAMDTFKAKKSDPHFTVSAKEIFQHIDTSVAARALKNPPGGVETNRDSAIQIEVVGFAGAPKPAAVLKQVARLCRWIEAEHKVPKVWPNGFPKPAKNGGDPGGHNRNSVTWDKEAGHYGHCHVPENVHWDPAYSKAEVDFLMAAEFDDTGALLNPHVPAIKTLLSRKPRLGLAPPKPCVMHDHGDGNDVSEAVAEIADTPLPSVTPPAANFRKLTIIAKDPGLRLGGPDGPMAFVQVDVPAELLAKGPTGYRIQITDYNATEGLAYRDCQQYQMPDGTLLDPFAPGDHEDFHDPDYQERLLADPNFHAQNTYAIAMRTLARFERALGRRVGWSSGRHQLHVAPHAFEQPNAFYSEPDRALMFGYFTNQGGHTIFSCLSHDIVAHETTHALLDGIKSYYTEPSLPDQAAFHEGFADIVALLSIFSLEDVVAAAIGQDGEYVAANGRISLVAAAKLTPKAIRKSIFAGLASQLGTEIESGRHDALRRSVELEEDRGVLQKAEMQEEHRRGEVLVAAVMNAFIHLWCRRIEGLGTFDDGKYNLSMVVEEGAKAAEQLLTMCIRGLDYCPPTDLDFGQYLAGVLTADAELVPNDSRYGYRKLLREAFAKYGISAPSTECDTDGIWCRVSPKEVFAYSRSNYEAMTRDRNEMFRFLWENRKALHISERVPTEVVSIDSSTRLSPDGMWLKETICQYVQIADVFSSEVGEVLKAERPKDMKTNVRLRAFGSGVVVFDQYGQVKYHIYNPLEGGARQTRRLVYLDDTDQLAPRRLNCNHFGMVHIDRIMG